MDGLKVNVYTKPKQRKNLLREDITLHCTMNECIKTEKIEKVNRGTSEQRKRLSLKNAHTSIYFSWMARMPCQRKTHINCFSRFLIRSRKFSTYYISSIRLGMWNSQMFPSHVNLCPNRTFMSFRTINPNFSSLAIIFCLSFSTRKLLDKLSWRWRCFTSAGL